MFLPKLFVKPRETVSLRRSPGTVFDGLDKLFTMVWLRMAGSGLGSVFKHVLKGVQCTVG